MLDHRVNKVYCPSDLDKCISIKRVQCISIICGHVDWTKTERGEFLLHPLPLLLQIHKLKIAQLK